VTPSYHKHAKCWRVQVPAAESETGKRVTEYFETKEEAEDFITEHRKTGSIQLADLSVQEKYVLGLIRQSVDYTPELLWDVWRAYKTNQGAQRKGSVTVAELCKAFYNRQIQEKRSYRTIADDRWRLNQFAKAVGILDSKQCTSVDISRYLEAKPPGSNRRSHFKTLRKLWRWAVQLGYVAVDPMANTQPADKWGINAEHLTVAFYTRLLRVVAARVRRSLPKQATVLASGTRFSGSDSGNWPQPGSDGGKGIRTPESPTLFHRFPCMSTDALKQRIYSRNRK
jgi:hypothetical protein